jgi:hypothetical protein
MNDVAAHALAGVLLPSYSRPCTGTASSGAAGLGQLPQQPAAPAAAKPGGSRGPACRLMSSLLQHLCPHPMYRLLSASCLPLVPPKAREFTTTTWPATLKRLRQMQLTGAMRLLWTQQPLSLLVMAVQAAPWPPTAAARPGSPPQAAP